MDIKDLAGLSQPLTKLIEVTAQGIGGVSKPFLTRANAKADAYRIEKITAALTEAASISGSSIEYKDGAIEVLQVPELLTEHQTDEQRTESRLAYQEHKRTSNLEKITSGAAQELVDEEQVSNEPLDEDWIARFFATAQDVSSEEMQQIWSRILAGEVKQPGTYSLRALEFIKNMSREEAEFIASIGQYTVIGGSDNFIPNHNEEWLDENMNITQQMFIRLTEIGVISPTALSFQSKNKELVLRLGNDTGIFVKASGDAAIPNLSVWKFTPVAVELLSLINRADDRKYINYIAEYYKTKNIKVHLVKIKNIRDGGIESTIVEEL